MLPFCKSRVEQADDFNLESLIDMCPRYEDSIWLSVFYDDFSSVTDFTEASVGWLMYIGFLCLRKVVVPENLQCETVCTDPCMFAERQSGHMPREAHFCPAARLRDAPRWGHQL